MKSDLYPPITAGVKNYMRRLRLFGPVAKGKVKDPYKYLNSHARGAPYSAWEKREHEMLWRMTNG